MKTIRLPRPQTARLVILLSSLAWFSSAHGQPTIKSVVPANLASGVSPSAPVVFTFSEAMDTNATSAIFMDISNPMSPLPTTDSWSAANTVLTCTPNPPFPGPGKMIVWSVDGANPSGDSLDGETGGMFTTGSGSGGNTGSGTNKVTAFGVGKMHYYTQSSAGAPVLEGEYSPYGFMATTILASNRTATGVSMTLPTGGTINLSQNMFAPEDFTAYAFTNDLAALDTAYPAGNYVFTLQSATPPLPPVTVNLPSTNNMSQPNAPHISNFAAAQSATPGQPFTLTWDPFQNPTASDYIWVDVGSDFSTGNFGQTNALKGTATSVVIPGNFLQPNSTNDVTIGFYRFVVITNAPGNYVTEAYRATATRSTLVTSGGGSTGTPPTLGKMASTGSGFQFDLTCSPAQDVTVEYSSTLQPGSWQKLITTNSSTGTVRITDPRSLTNKALFYRARTGS